MNLILIIAIPLIAAALAWISSLWSTSLPRWISLLGVVLDFSLALSLWPSFHSLKTLQDPSQNLSWITESHVSWIPQWGISFHLALDGLNFLLILLSLFLGIISIVISWETIRQRIGFFHLNLLCTLSGILGVFLSIDLFLFYFFWELMLVPMYFLIGIWGHDKRTYAAMKFFLFTQASGLLMFLSIIGLYFEHGKISGNYTFDYTQLIHTPLQSSLSFWLMLGFFVAFAVKLPVFPLHTWLPDAHTEAPTAGSVILAGLLLKTGGYGLIRFVLPFFPKASASFSPIAMILAIVGIIYGSVLAFAQKDFKRLVAYTSVSHLGFVLLGIFAGTSLALQGAIIQMICHGLSTGGLFVIVGAIQDRIHTRNIDEMGGFWLVAPRMSSIALFFALASLGLPGLGNFVGEFLTLLGTYQVNSTYGILASLGFITSTLYSLGFIQAVFHGLKKESLTASLLPDFSYQETAVMVSLMILLIWIGIYPQPLFNTLRDSSPKVLHVFH